VMNMIGSPNHVKKCLEVGVDLICAQGGEGGGHTGEVPTSLLIPKVVDLCRGQMSPLTGKPVGVVAAGGIYDGRGLAMALSLGAQGVWVGTRFVASDEAGAPPRHKKDVVECGYHDTIRTIIYTGRTLRVKKTPYIMDWEENKASEIKELTSKGILPVENEMTKKNKEGTMTGKDMMEMHCFLMGQTAGAIDEVKPAAVIMDDMITDAIEILRTNVSLIGPEPPKRFAGATLDKNYAGYPTPASKL